MKAILCTRHGPPESLILADIAPLEPRPGEVIVSVHAAAVNFPDTLIIQDKYQFRPALPFSPGGEAAGKSSRWGRMSLASSQASR